MIRIRPADPSRYSGRVWIEAYRGKTPDDWAVPDWASVGLLELAGPFESVDQAWVTLFRDKDHLQACGFTFEIDPPTWRRIHGV